MGFASYYEDNLDARGESVRGRHRRLTLSTEKIKKTQREKPVESQFTLRKKSMESQFTLERRPNFTRSPWSKRSPKPLQQKTTRKTCQDIRRREPQKTQHARVQKTQHVPVMKTQYVTTGEIERRIQREIVRQSRLKE